MSRFVDPQKYALRRASIVTAASTEFAVHGFSRATTAGICRAAGISSGTFFHYFPTKLEVLLAVLEDGLDELRARLARIEELASGLAALLSYAASSEAEMSDASYPVFVSGLAGVEADPAVAAALAAEAELVAGFLTRQVENGQRSGEIDSSVPALQLATWVAWLLDGAAQATAAGHAPLKSQVQEAIRTLLTVPR